MTFFCSEVSNKTLSVFLLFLIFKKITDSLNNINSVLDIFAYATVKICNNDTGIGGRFWVYNVIRTLYTIGEVV